MTSKEKQAVFSHILEQGEVKNAALERIAPVKSPWTIYSFNNWFTAHRAFALTVAIILIVSIGSDGIVQAAKGSLPGDVLYPIKVHVAEPLQEALTFSSVAKAQLKADLTIQRVQEAESLATEGRLDASKQAQISNMIEDQTKDLNASLKAVAATDPIAATDISSGFKKMMDARARKLDALTGVLSNRQTNIVSTSTIKTDVIQGTKIQNQAEQPQNKTKDAII